MKITDAEASRLTRFLCKGIFENPENKDVAISIGENAQIGIMRHGHKHILYIRYNDVIDKQNDTLSGFNENVAQELLSKNLKSLIERSKALKDVTLNMEKVPMFLQEDENVPESANIVTTERVPAENAEEIAPSTGQSQGLVPFEEDGHGKERPDKEYDSEETEPDKEDNSEETGPAKEDVSENDFLNEQLGTQQVSEPDKKINLEELNMMGTTETGNTEIAVPAEKENRQIEASSGVKGLMPTEVNNARLLEESYLANIISTDAEMKEKLFKSIDQLILRDKSSAVEFYIRILYRLLPLFNNDISSASEGTKLDERDFMLAVYERNYFNN